MSTVIAVILFVGVIAYALFGGPTTEPASGI